MNEAYFLLHIVIVVVFSLGALRFGKEALVFWVGLQAVLANLFVVKQIELVGLTVTCSDVYIIGSVFGLNLLQEYHGKELAKKVVSLTFLGMLFFSITSWIHLQYQPASVDFAHNAYFDILGVMPRIFIASISTFFVVQQFDVRFFAFLKRVFPGLGLAVRGALSLCVSQCFDTVLFSLGGLYGVVANLGDVMIVSMAIKLLVIAAVTPFNMLARRVA